MLKNWKARKAEEAAIRVQSELIEAARTSRLGLQRYLTQGLEANQYLAPWEISDSHPWRGAFRVVRDIFLATASVSSELRAYFEIYVEQAIDVLWAALEDPTRGEAAINEELEAARAAGLRLRDLDLEAKACKKSADSVKMQFAELTRQAGVEVHARSTTR